MLSDPVSRDLGVAGALFLVASAFTAVLAGLHMQALGAMCGSDGPALHCGACYATVALFAAGLSCAAASVRRSASASAPQKA